MKLNSYLLAALAVSCLSATLGHAATVVIASGTTTTNFNDLGTGLPAGWDVRTGATTSALGTAATLTTATSTWGDTGGAFKNVASSAGLVSTSTTTAQNASTDRALGLRQTGSFGDPGAAMNYNFSTVDVEITTISLDLLLLSSQARSTTFSIQYGVGANPTTWTTLGTYDDPGAWGSTTVSFTPTNFGTDLNDQENLWFRVVALGSSTSSGVRDTFAIDNFAITAVAAPVPEPGAAALLGMLGAMGILRRRR